MNLPFGLPSMRDTNRRKEEAVEVTYYERKLADYREYLEKYKSCLLDYAVRLEGYEKHNMDNQLSIVQTALDLTYLKEQGEKLIQLVDDLKTEIPYKGLISVLDSLDSSVAEVNCKLDSLDRNAVNRLSEFMIEMQKKTALQDSQAQAELFEEIDRLKKSVKKGNALSWFMFFFSLLSLSGIIFIGLYIMEIIPF